ncbi:MAG: glycosyltransferase [Verrucomicrobiota bacterium]
MKAIRQRAKFFFEGDRKWFLQGVTYGPFEPQGKSGLCLPRETQVRSDLDQMRRIGVNLIRLYHQPPEWLLDAAGNAGIRVITTVPWPLRGLFLDNVRTRQTILKNMRDAARDGAGHPARLGFFVDNEMPADLVRWFGRRQVQRFLNECIAEIKHRDAEALVSYAGFPPSESVLPDAVDFYSFNVYLHRRETFQGYLARLQHLAGDKPVVLSEFGMDTLRHSEEEQAQLFTNYLEDCYRGGAAGAVLFSWTDEWFTGGEAIQDWKFGLVDENRHPKLAYRSVGKCFLSSEQEVTDGYPLDHAPYVSIVVCSYNGADTLKECLQALQQQNYPRYEIIVVNDGSTDHTREILQDFADIRIIHQENAGLSVARNRGIEESHGGVVAFTDSDCMPDADWLYYLIQTLQQENTAAVGGPNISPPATQWVQAAVAAAPGSPSHVLFDDYRAEHVPGCNMAFRKDALQQLGGFNPVYRKAGDDVDVCWKLLDLGYEIAFSPSAVVWHHRRFTVSTYFSQQSGYGEAEALLRFQHTSRFDTMGNSRWQGKIYGGLSTDTLFYRPMIYRGLFATGAFQSMYTQSAGSWIALFGSLQWLALTGFMLMLSVGFPALRMLPAIMFGLMLFSAWIHMSQARLEPRFDGFKTRLLVFYLSFLQPLSRAWARYFVWMERKRTPHSVVTSKEERPHHRPAWWKSGLLEVWSQEGKSRLELLQEMNELFEEEGWCYVLDNGWSNWDMQFYVNRWWNVRVRTQSEAHPHGACLTRVGLMLASSSFSVLAGILLFGIGMSLSVAFAGWLPGVLLLWAGAITYWMFSGLRARRRVAETVLAATRQQGMRRLETMEDAS